MATTISSRKASPQPFKPAISVLLPHPPIIVPPIGKERLRNCRATLEACRRIAKLVVAKAPARLFLVSPHTPRTERRFGVIDGERLRGDFDRFGAPQVALDLPNDLAGLDALLAVAEQGDVALERLSTPLDHGALVPLYFLAEAGWRGPTLIAALPWHFDHADCHRFGRLVGRALDALEGPAAMVASGDMSHRCLPDAPAGFHPRAVDFDRELTRLVAAGDFQAIANIDPDLRHLAAEDAADTTMIVTAAHGFADRGAEVLSYEHPFGVGYLVAVLYQSG